MADDDASGQGTPDKEYPDAPVDCFEGRLHVNTGMIGFGGHYGDVFGSDAGEGCCPKSRQEAFKFPEGAGADVLGEITGGPGSEAVGVVMRVTTRHCDQSKSEKHREENDFAAREVELSLSVNADSKDVDEATEK